MDLGLTTQQRRILKRARSKGLKGARSWQLQPPLWLILLLTLLPLLLVMHPVRYLALLLLPPLGLWQRQRVERRFQEWALDLRQA